MPEADDVKAAGGLDLVQAQQQAQAIPDLVRLLVEQINVLGEQVRALTAIAPKDVDGERIFLEEPMRDWRLAEGIASDEELPAVARAAHPAKVSRRGERLHVSFGGDDQAHPALHAVFEIAAGVPCVHVNSADGDPTRCTVYGLPAKAVALRQSDVPASEADGSFSPEDSPLILRRVLHGEGFHACDGDDNPVPGSVTDVCMDVLSFKERERFAKLVGVPGSPFQAKLVLEIGPDAVTLTALVAGQSEVVTKRDMPLVEGREAGSAVNEMLILMPSVLSEVRDYVQRLDNTQRI